MVIINLFYSIVIGHAENGRYARCEHKAIGHAWPAIPRNSRHFDISRALIAVAQRCYMMPPSMASRPTITVNLQHAIDLRPISSDAKAIDWPWRRYAVDSGRRREIHAHQLLIKPDIVIMCQHDFMSVPSYNAASLWAAWTFFGGLLSPHSSQPSLLNIAWAWQNRWGDISCFSGISDACRDALST